LHGGESRRLGGGQSGRVRRATERSEAVLALTRDAERLPTGRQDVDPRHSCKNRPRQAGCRVDHMLAIVEQQQHSPVPKGGDQAGKRIVGADFQTKNGGNGARHQARIA